jgi:3-hydroxyisobutyrate dehydrogenase
MESEDGIIGGLSEGKIWLEMSTTDDAEVIRLANIVEAKGATAMDCPVSGGCHRAATGNISIFVGGDRETFERVLPILTTMGRRIRRGICSSEKSRHGHEHNLRSHPYFIRKLFCS